MSSITERPDSLLQSGPHVAVKLWVPRQVQSTIPPIDTFAEINPAYPRTFIQEGVATSLGLQPARVIRISTATAFIYETYLYQIRIALTDNGRAFEVTAAEVPFMLRPQARVKCLIGRDILQYYILSYNGPEDTFNMEFKG